MSNNPTADAPIAIIVEDIGLAVADPDALALADAIRDESDASVPVFEAVEDRVEVPLL